MTVIDWFKQFGREESQTKESDRLDIQPGDVELDFTPAPTTWDCPNCRTHEAMTNSDTLEANWWCTVCEFTTDEEPPFDYE